jgi:hypothetical protein
MKGVGRIVIRGVESPVTKLQKRLDTSTDESNLVV